MLGAGRLLTLFSPFITTQKDILTYMKVSKSINKFKGSVKSNILAIMPKESLSVGILKNIQAKLTIRKVTVFLTVFPNHP